MTNTTRPAEEDGGNLPPLPAMIPEGTALAHAVREYARQAVHRAQAPEGFPECSGCPDSCPENEGYGCCREEMAAAPGAAAAASEEADMFWLADDGEAFGFSLEELLESHDPGQVVRVSQAKSLPIITVRVLEGGACEVIEDAARSAQAQGGAA